MNKKLQKFILSTGEVNDLESLKEHLEALIWHTEYIETKDGDGEDIIDTLQSLVDDMDFYIRRREHDPDAAYEDDYKEEAEMQKWRQL